MTKQETLRCQECDYEDTPMDSDCCGKCGSFIYADVSFAEYYGLKQDCKNLRQQLELNSSQNTGNSCKFCETTDCLMAITFDNYAVDVRFDTENCQLDLMVYKCEDSNSELVHDTTIDIKYCPFCKRSLKEVAI